MAIEVTIAELLIKAGVSVEGATDAANVVKKVKEQTEQLRDRGGKALSEFADEGKKALKSADSALNKADRAAVRVARRVDKSLRNTGKRVRNTAREIKKDITDLVPVLSFDARDLFSAGIHTLRAIPDAIQSVADKADAIAKSADKYQLTTDEVQRLSSAAGHAGTEIQVLGEASLEFNKTLQEELKASEEGLKAITEGGKEIFELRDEKLSPFLKALKAIKVDANELAGIGAIDRFALISDGLNNVESESERAALRLTLLGDKGREMGNFLKQGGDAIKEVTGAARGVIPEETLRKAESFNDRMQDSREKLEALRTEILIEGAPAIAEIQERFVKLIQENDEFLKQDLPGYITAIGQAAIESSKLIASMIDGIARAGNAIENTEIFEALLRFNGVEHGPDGRRRKRFVDGKVDRGTIGNYLEDTRFNRAILAAQGATIDPVTRERVTFEELEKRKRQRRLANTPDSDYELVAFDNAGNLLKDEQGNILSGQEAGLSTDQSRLNSEINRARRQYQNSDLRKLVTSASEGISALSDVAVNLFGEEPRPPKPKSKKKRGGGSKPKKEEKREVQLTSFEELLGSTLGPDFELTKLQSVRSVDVAPDDIKPESVVNITNNNITIGAPRFNITETKSARDTADRTVARLERFTVAQSNARSSAAQTGVKR